MLIVLSSSSSAKVAQLGEECSGLACTSMQWSIGSCSMSLSHHHKKHRNSMSDLDTLTLWNIDLMSAMSTTGSLLNLGKTPTSELVRSGPCNSSELRDE